MNLPCPALPSSSGSLWIHASGFLTCVCVGALLLALVSIMCIGGTITRIQHVLLFSTDYAK
jgi:hypothetical protein